MSVTVEVSHCTWTGQKSASKTPKTRHRADSESPPRTMTGVSVNRGVDDINLAIPYYKNTIYMERLSNKD